MNIFKLILVLCLLPLTGFSQELDIDAVAKSFEKAIKILEESNEPLRKTIDYIKYDTEILEPIKEIRPTDYSRLTKKYPALSYAFNKTESYSDPREYSEYQAHQWLGSWFQFDAPPNPAGYVDKKH